MKTSRIISWLLALCVSTAPVFGALPLRRRGTPNRGRPTGRPGPPGHGGGGPTRPTTGRPWGPGRAVGTTGGPPHNPNAVFPPHCTLPPPPGEVVTGRPHV